eukprot:m.334885 g.334885  ORF g.334885 m.334885 type:complete len:2064 (+) comp17460_c0_seq1:146-6337(+)
MGTYVLNLNTGAEPLGIKLMKNPATGKGAAIKSVDPGGQVDRTGKVSVGDLIVAVNGINVQESTMKEIGGIIKQNPEVEFTMMKDMTVTLDTSTGSPLGLKLMKNPATGTGVAVKSLDPGAQAEQTGKFTPGDIITHINGTDVTSASMREIGGLIKSNPLVTFTLKSVEPEPEPEPEPVPAVYGDPEENTPAPAEPEPEPEAAPAEPEPVPVEEHVYGNDPEPEAPPVEDENLYGNAEYDPPSSPPTQRQETAPAPAPAPVRVTQNIPAVASSSADGKFPSGAVRAKAVLTIPGQIHDLVVDCYDVPEYDRDGDTFCSGQLVEHFSFDGGPNGSNEFKELQNRYYESSIKLAENHYANFDQEVSVEFTPSTNETDDPTSVGVVRIDVTIRNLVEKPQSKPKVMRVPTGVDIVFCIDCTKSMDPYLQGIKEQLRTMIDKLSTHQKKPRIGLVVFWDHWEEEVSHRTPQVHEFTEDIDSIEAFIDTLVCTGGGDGPEDVTGGLWKCVDGSLRWEKDRYKQVFLITDSPAHGKAYTEGVTYKGQPLHDLLGQVMNEDNDVHVQEGKSWVNKPMPGDGEKTAIVHLNRDQKRGAGWVADDALTKTIVHRGGRTVISRLIQAGIHLVALDISEQEDSMVDKMFDKFRSYYENVQAGAGTFDVVRVHDASTGEPSSAALQEKINEVVVTKVQEGSSKGLASHQHVKWNYKYTDDQLEQLCIDYQYVAKFAPDHFEREPSAREEVADQAEHLRKKADRKLQDLGLAPNKENMSEGDAVPIDSEFKTVHVMTTWGRSKSGHSVDLDSGIIFYDENQGVVGGEGNPLACYFGNKKPLGDSVALDADSRDGSKPENITIKLDDLSSHDEVTYAVLYVCSYSGVPLGQMKKLGVQCQGFTDEGKSESLGKFMLSNLNHNETAQILAVFKKRKDNDGNALGWVMERRSSKAPGTIPVELVKSSIWKQVIAASLVPPKPPPPPVSEGAVCDVPVLAGFDMLQFAMDMKKVSKTTASAMQSAKYSDGDISSTLRDARDGAKWFIPPTELRLNDFNLSFEFWKARSDMNAIRDDLGTRLDVVETNKASNRQLETEVSQLKDLIGETEGKMSSLGDKIEALQGNLGTNDSNDEDTAEKVEKLSSDMEELRTLVNQLQADLEEVKNRPVPEAGTTAAAAPAAEEPEYNEDLKRKLQELFEAADQSDGVSTFSSAKPDGYLDATELRFRLNTRKMAELLRDAGVLHKLDKDGDGNVTMSEIMAGLDKDGDGMVSLEEFLSVALKPKYDPELRERLKKIFNDADYGSQYLESFEFPRLNMKELMDILRDAGVLHKLDRDGDGKVTARELTAALDKDGDGKISMEEFLKLALSEGIKKPSSGDASGIDASEFQALKDEVAALKSLRDDIAEQKAAMQALKEEMQNVSSAPKDDLSGFDAAPAGVTMDTLRTEISSVVSKLQGRINNVESAAQEDSKVAAGERQELSKRLDDLEKQIGSMKSQLASKKVSQSPRSSPKVQRKKPNNNNRRPPQQQQQPRPKSNTTVIAPNSLRSKLKRLFDDADQSDGVGTFSSARPDGYLDKTELKFRLHRNKLTDLLKSAGILDRFDKNRDGKLSLDELLDSLDKDQDGKISLEEFLNLALGVDESNLNLDGFEEPLPPMIVSPRVLDGLRKLFNRADQSDGISTFSTAKPDRYLDLTELRFRLNSNELARLLKQAGVLHKIDANGDGVLTIEEMMVALDQDQDGKISLEEFLDVALVGKKHTVTPGTSWDDPRNSANRMGKGTFVVPRTSNTSPPRSSSPPKGPTVSSAVMHKLQGRMKKLYESAEKEHGISTGSYIPPERAFDKKQMAIMLSEKDVYGAIGRLKMFDKSKGAVQSVADIFQNLPLDSTNRVSLESFLTYVDPLLTVKANMSASDFSVVDQEIPESTKGKLADIFEKAEIVSNGKAIKLVGEVKGLSRIELLYKLSVFGFSELLQEVTEFSYFDTSNGVEHVDDILRKLESRGMAQISLDTFFKYVSLTQKSGNKSNQGSRKKMNTWGRRKKNKNLDIEFGVYEKEAKKDEEVDPDDFQSKRSVFGDSVLY